MNKRIGKVCLFCLLLILAAGLILGCANWFGSEEENGTGVGNGGEENGDGEGEAGGDPQLILPLSAENLDRVAFIQAYEPTAGHIGIDFGFRTPPSGTDLIEFISPAAGTVRQADELTVGIGLYMFDLVIEINDEWGILMAFEPGVFPGTAEAFRQRDNITVSVGDEVSQGDLVGRLLVINESEIPGDSPPSHIHWSVFRGGSSEIEYVCPRTYCLPAAQSQLDNLFTRYGREVCYD